jgi:2,3,4,5-tetrahydropyridine-2-carboxylate N-succinyltransferase
MKTVAPLLNQAWEERAQLSPQSQGPTVDAVTDIIRRLDAGDLRIAEKKEGTWHVNVWAKQAVLLYFRLRHNEVIEGAARAFDKVPLKFTTWLAQDFEKSGIRIIPGAIVRYGAYLGPNVVVMPSLVNIGAFVDEGTLIDSYATIGSCAQIGKRCHISSNSVIGGILEPIQANPVIIEDNCFIGANTSLVEGMIVEEGAVIGMGVCLGTSTPLIDRETGIVTYGRVPAYSVVVPGTIPSSKTSSDIRTTCGVIVKRVTAETRSKTSINELLRA